MTQEMTSTMVKTKGVANYALEVIRPLGDMPEKGHE